MTNSSLHDPASRPGRLASTESEAGSTDLRGERVAESSYVPTLDGWRCLAILGVILYHATPPSSAFYPFARQGFRGVDVFFSISGFLICSRLLDEERRLGTIQLASFYVRRAFRILPPAFLYIAIVMILGGVGILTPMPALEWISSLFFFRNYLPASVGTSEYSGHYWSLSVEEHFYLFFPGLLVLLGSSRARLAVPALALLVVVWRTIDGRLDLISVIWPTAFPFLRTDRCLDTLLLGCALALLAQHPPSRRWLTRLVNSPAWYGLVAVYVVIIVYPPLLSHTINALLVPLILFGTVTRPERAVSRLLELAPVRWIGRLSYSIYIWQTLFFVGLFRPPEFLQSFPVNAICVLGIASCSYYLVEKPMIAYGRRVARSTGARHSGSKKKPHVYGEHKATKNTESKSAQ